jgi:hypothetical protein
MTVVYQERAASLKREWAGVPGLRRLIEDIERQTSPETRVVLAEVTVQMIPYTVVQLDIGHQDVVVEGEDAPKHAQDDAVHTIQIGGFENKLHVGKFAIDGERRFLYILVTFLGIIAVILLTYILLFL